MEPATPAAIFLTSEVLLNNGCYYDNTSLKAKHERKRSLEELTKENKELKTRLQATEEDLTNTQVALTEVYEMLAGGGENG